MNDKNTLGPYLIVSIILSSYIVLFFPRIEDFWLRWGFYLTSAVFGMFLVINFGLDDWRLRE